MVQMHGGLRSARVHMNRADFTELLSRVTISDLRIAADEEKWGVLITTPGICVLPKHLHVLAAKVVSSNEACNANRSKIWSVSALLEPPTLWITINPSDIHDPLA